MQQGWQRSGSGPVSYTHLDVYKRQALLEAKEESIKTKNELDKETKERRAELQRYERRVLSKEENLDKKAENMERREANLCLLYTSYNGIPLKRRALPLSPAVHTPAPSASAASAAPCGPCTPGERGHTPSQIYAFSSSLTGWSAVFAFPLSGAADFPAGAADAAATLSPCRP